MSEMHIFIENRGGKGSAIHHFGITHSLNRLCFITILHTYLIGMGTDFVSG
jgi:membrane-bound metal-dependent hydrolase YbcI (DUF457 family)